MLLLYFSYNNDLHFFLKMPIHALETVNQIYLDKHVLHFFWNLNATQPPFYCSKNNLKMLHTIFCQCNHLIHMF